MKTILAKWAKWLGIIGVLAAFGIWMNIVAYPHLAETAVGLFGVGIYLWYKLSKERD